MALDIGRCFNEAMDIYKKNVLMLVVSALVFQVLVLLSLTICAGPLFGGFCIMMLNAMRKDTKTIDMKDMFSLFGRFLPLMGLFYLQALATALGFVLLVIPGLIVATMWIYAMFVAADKNKGPVEAMKTSWNVVKPNFWMNFALMVLYLAVSIVPSQIPFVGFILSFFIMPFAMLMIASSYQQQFADVK